MQHESGPHSHLKHRLSSAWSKTYVMYSQCEFGEGLWLQGEAALQIHRFRDQNHQVLRKITECVSCTSEQT